MTDRPAKRPVIAIVTPSFNQAEFLEQTICSVLDQKGRGTDFDLEYAVVDGGSSDGSSDIIRRYQSELRFWCSEKDRGQTHAINKGFDGIPAGDIRGYLNSDDFYLPGAFQHAVKAFAAKPDVDLVHGICQKVDAAGRPFQQQLAEIRNLAECVDLWERWLRRGGNLNFIQPEVFWSGRLAERLGPFNEKLYYTMDFDYWLRGFDAGMIVQSIEEPLAAFRVHENQKTSARNASILELLDRIEPYLHSGDERISDEHRQRLCQHSSLTRQMIAEADSGPAKQVRCLLTMAADQPSLWRSNHFWCYLRRSSRRVLWPQRRAA
jgi:GT2 family glycosyltransferase